MNDDDLSPRLRALVTSLLTLAQRYGVKNERDLYTIEVHAEAMLKDAKAEAIEEHEAEQAKYEEWERQWRNERRREQRAAKKAAGEQKAG